MNAGSGSRGVLFKYYPVVEKQVTQVVRPSVMQGVVTNLILAGTDGSGKNILTALNTSNDQETMLIGPDDEIEIYNLNYVADALSAILHPLGPVSLFVSVLVESPGAASAFALGTRIAVKTTDTASATRARTQSPPRC